MNVLNGLFAGVGIAAVVGGLVVGTKIAHHRMVTAGMTEVMENSTFDVERMTQEELYRFKLLKQASKGEIKLSVERTNEYMASVLPYMIETLL